MPQYYSKTEEKAFEQIKGLPLKPTDGAPFLDKDKLDAFLAFADGKHEIRSSSYTGRPLAQPLFRRSLPSSRVQPVSELLSASSFRLNHETLFKPPILPKSLEVDVAQEEIPGFPVRRYACSIEISHTIWLTRQKASSRAFRQHIQDLLAYQ